MDWLLMFHFAQWAITVTLVLCVVLLGRQVGLIVNTLEHLESLLLAAELGAPTAEALSGGHVDEDLIASPDFVSRGEEASRVG